MGRPVSSCALSALCLILAASLNLRLPASRAEEPAQGGQAPAAGGPPAPHLGRGPETERLAAALALKEERKLTEAIRELETLALAGRTGPAVPGFEREPRPNSSLGGSSLAVLGQLEAIDARMRAGLLGGLEPRLQLLAESWGENRDVRRRVRALQGLLPLLGGSLLEPNAIARVDAGDRFLARFFHGQKGSASPRIPLDLPLRHLSDLPIGEPGGTGSGHRPRPVVVAGFLGIEELTPERREPWRPAWVHFDQDPRALLALFVYTGDAELPPPAPAEEPWSRAVIFWIRGTPFEIASGPIRSRYEWLPGPTFFLLGPGGRLRSWRWPEEGWKGFLTDVREELSRTAGGRTTGTAPPPPGGS
jgi:hypothetical protein